MRRNDGFTLVEIMVSMVLLGLVAALSHQVLGAVTDVVDRTGTAAAQNDRTGNRYAWLVRTVGSAASGSSPNRGFAGVNGEMDGAEADYLDFYARTPLTPGIAFVRIGRADNSLVAQVVPEAGGTLDTLVLADSVASFGADYLLDYGANSRWVSEWVSPVSAPVAVRFRYTFLSGAADTLLLHMGVRG